MPAVQTEDIYKVFVPAEVERLIRARWPGQCFHEEAESRNVTVDQLLEDPNLYEMCRAYAWRDKLAKEIADGERLPSGDVVRNFA